MEKQKRKKAVLIVLGLITALVLQAFQPILAQPTDVEINEANFPDAIFREFVKAYDTDNDGTLQQNELNAVTEMDCSSREIANLKGIEHFTALEQLNCAFNPLGSLDVSNNTALTQLSCLLNALTSLDVTNNTALTQLSCTGNYLASLDVSNNTALTQLSCDGNALSSLDVTNNTALTRLSCGGNAFSSLDVSNNTVLEWLDCCDGQQLTSLNVNGCTTLKSLNCRINQLTSLDLSGCAALETLICYNNQLASLNLNGCTALKSLDCSNNQFNSLDVSSCAAMTELLCGSNCLSSLDLSNNTALYRLLCDNNQLGSLDVSNNTALKLLDCSDNQLSSLDVSNNTALIDLQCESNQITLLDVSNNIDLRVLLCHRNPISSLDVSNNTALRALQCSDNQLSSLDVSNNAALKALQCNDNLLTSLDVDNNPALKILICHNNQLTSLDLSKNNYIGFDEHPEYVEDIGLVVSSQTCPTPLHSTWNGSHYEFDLSNIVGDDKIENITAVKQSDNSDLPASASYVEATGILKVDPGEILDSIIYCYDVKVPLAPSTRMDVIVDLTYRFNVTLNPDNDLESSTVVTLDEGADYTLPNNTFTAPTGRKFKAWEVNGDDKQPGYSLSIADHTEIKAIWELLSFTVTYQDENGNVLGEPQIVNYGFDAIPETVPDKTNHTGVWNHNGKNITADTTIRPIYEEIEMIEQPSDPVWVKGSEEPASFTSNAEYKDFVCVKLNEEVVDKENYDVTEGSIIVTFKPEFLATLPEGKYKVEIVSTTGSAVGVIEIKESERVMQPGTTIPTTGEVNKYYPWTVLLLLSAGGLFFIVRKKRLLQQRD